METVGIAAASVQSSHIHGRAEARKSARASYLPASPESGEPTTLPISPYFWPRWATFLVCFLVLSAFTHTEQTGWDTLWGCRTREPACFKPSDGEVYVQELRHFVLRSTWPLTTVYTSASLPILAFSRASRKANESPECFTTGTIP